MDIIEVVSIAVDKIIQGWTNKLKNRNSMNIILYWNIICFKLDMI